jgi:signal transduction histidine kinase
MNNNIKQFQELNLFAVQLKEQKKALQLFINAAKYITDTSVSMINIFLGYSHWAVTLSEDEVKFIPRDECIFKSCTDQDELFEIADLKNEREYLNHPYVVGTPNFRYFCSAPLITSNGNHTGSICLLDPKTRKLNAEQKRQFINIAKMVVSKIENEIRYDELSSKLDKLNDSMIKLNHDIRSPINGIVGITDILLNDDDVMNENTDEIVMIKKSAQTITDIIDGVLLIHNRNLTNDNLLDNKPISTTLIKINHLYQPLIQSKKMSINFINKIDNHVMVPHYLFIKLLQIIGNLVANAIKFTPRGGAVEIGMDLNKVNGRNRLDVYVKDDGISMKRSQVISFNEDNPVARSAGTEGEKSFGIGLQHVKQMINDEGGEIKVNSKKGIGTLFELSIPLTSIQIDGMNNSELFESDSTSEVMDMLNI